MNNEQRTCTYKIGDEVKLVVDSETPYCITMVYPSNLQLTKECKYDLLSVSEKRELKDIVERSWKPNKKDISRFWFSRFKKDKQNVKKSECEALINSKNHLIGTVVEIIRGRKTKTKIKGVVVKIYCVCFTEVDGTTKKENCKAIAIINQNGKAIKVSVNELP